MADEHQINNEPQVPSLLKRRVDQFMARLGLRSLKVHIIVCPSEEALRRALEELGVELPNGETCALIATHAPMVAASGEDSDSAFEVEQCASFDDLVRGIAEIDGRAIEIIVAYCDAPEWERPFELDAEPDDEIRGADDTDIIEPDWGLPYADL